MPLIWGSDRHDVSPGNGLALTPLTLADVDPPDLEASLGLSQIKSHGSAVRKVQRVRLTRAGRQISLVLGPVMEQFVGGLEIPKLDDGL